MGITLQSIAKRAVIAAVLLLRLAAPGLPAQESEAEPPAVPAPLEEEAPEPPRQAPQGQGLPGGSGGEEESGPWHDKLLRAVGRYDRALQQLYASSVDLWQPGGKSGEPPRPSGGLTADDLYRSALRNNRELLQLHLEQNKARIDLRAAEAERFPTVDFQTSLTLIGNPMEPIKLKAGELGAYDTGTGTSVLIPTEDMVLYEGMEDTNYEFKFIVEQPLFTWGKIDNAVELYSRVSDTGGLQIAKKEKEIYTRILIYQAVLNYLNEIEALLKLQEETAERLVTLAEESYENGFMVYADLLEARIGAKEIDIAAAELDEKKHQALLNLSHLSGREGLENGDLDLSRFGDTVPPAPEVPEEELFRMAMENSEDIRLLEKLREISRLRLAIAEGSNYLKPDIGLRFELSYSGPRFPLVERDWFGKNRGNLLSTLAFQTTIFDGGKLAAEVLKQTQQVEKSLYQYEEGLSSIRQFISETLLKLELHRRNMEYYRLKAENDEQQIALKKTQMEAGAGDESSYLEEKLALYSDIIQYYREAVDYVSLHYQLQSLCGIVQPPPEREKPPEKQGGAAPRRDEN